MPSMARHLTALPWMWPLANTGTGGAPASPRSATSKPWRSPHHWRAAARPTKFAIVAPVTITPPHAAGSPNSSRSQASETISNVHASGEVTQA